MKTPLLILVASVAALTAALSQVAIPLDQPVVVQQPITTTQNVTVSEVAVSAITFDIANQKITFRLAGNQTGNGTITLTGAEYQNVRTQFLTPFSQAVAPTLRAKLGQ